MEWLTLARVVGQMTVVQLAAADRAAVRALAIVGVVSFAAQLALAPWRIAPSWDESIYLSQVAPGPALPFVASRARGIVAFVAPLAGAGVSLPFLRIVLAAAAAAAIVLAFVPWVRVIGRAAVWAAAVFASSWLSLFYGSEVMPNLWVAVLGVATVGVGIHAIGSPGQRNLLAITALLTAAAASFRPPDAVAIVVPILVLAAWMRAWRPAGALLAGLVVGVGLWVIEMSVRFGGLGGRGARGR